MSLLESLKVCQNMILYHCVHVVYSPHICLDAWITELEHKAIDRYHT